MARTTWEDPRWPSRRNGTKRIPSGSDVCDSRFPLAQSGSSLAQTTWEDPPGKDSARESPWPRRGWILDRGGSSLALTA